MKYTQRDVVIVEMELPDGKVEKHPYLIISSNRANSIESYYTAVMMTSSSHKDVFSFHLSNEMFESPLQKQNCQFRLYIIVSFRESRVGRFFNKMNKQDFARVLKEIKEYILVADS